MGKCNSMECAMNRSIIAHDHVTAAIYTFVPKEFWVEAMEMSRP